MQTEIENVEKSPLSCSRLVVTDDDDGNGGKM